MAVIAKHVQRPLLLHFADSQSSVATEGSKYLFLPVVLSSQNDFPTESSCQVFAVGWQGNSETELGSVAIHCRQSRKQYAAHNMFVI
jgi:hypothetical protein